MDFSSCLRYSKTMSYECMMESCLDDGICRCGKIFDIRLDSVNLDKMTNLIYSSLIPKGKKSKKRHNRVSQILYGGAQVDLYCIYRILVNYEVWDPKKWSFDIFDGYYGEEVGKCLLLKDIWKSVKADCKKAFNMESLTDKIRFVLKSEYGYLSKSIKNQNFKLCRVSKHDVNPSELNANYVKLIKSRKSFYSDESYSLPIGVFKKINGGYKIVDGYHRFLGTEKDTFDAFCVY